jgi:hypothetical protein
VDSRFRGNDGATFIVQQNSLDFVILVQISFSNKKPPCWAALSVCVCVAQQLSVARTGGGVIVVVIIRNAVHFRLADYD